ncbi:MAG: lysozyme inhibitor LprI family protein [Smithella sp.]|jgi:uncharacterized protein
MSQIKFVSLILCCLLFFTNSAQAASFDCKIAKSEREKLVCSDPQLSKSDEELMSVYAKTLKKTDDKKWLNKNQRAWLENVDFRAWNKYHPDYLNYLKEAYIERIAQLVFFIKAKDMPPLKTTKSEKEVCQEIRTEIETKGLMVFNRDSAGKKLGVLCGSPAYKCGVHADEIPIQKLISKGLVPSQIKIGGIDYWATHVVEIDFNNDGLPDLWLSLTGGSLYCQGNEFLLRTKEGTYINSISSYVSNFDEKGNFIAHSEEYYFDEEGALCDGDMLTFRKIDGLTYLVEAAEYKSSVFIFQPSGKLRKICSFKPGWTKAQKEIANIVRKKYSIMPPTVVIMRPELKTLDFDDPPFAKKGDQVWSVEANCSALMKPYAIFMVNLKRKDIKPEVKPGEAGAGSCDFK